MVNIQVRDVPEQVRDALAEAARTRGQSMQAYLRNLLEEDAQRADNVRLLREVADMGGGHVAGADDAASELASIRSDRDERNKSQT